MAAFALDTPDLDQARELVGRWIAPFGIVPCQPSGHRARVRAGRVGRIGVAAVSYQGAVNIHSRVPDDTLVLEIPVAGQCRTDRDRAGRPARRGAVMATPPGQRIRTWMGDFSRLLVVRIPAAVIDPSGEWDLASSDPWRWKPSQTLPPDRLASLERLAGLVFAETAGTGAVASDDALGAEMQQVLLALLGAPGRSIRRGPVVDTEFLPRAVCRAQALMIAAPNGGVSLPELASQCGVSLRTLQENFRRSTGMTPSEWWRTYRLERVNKALLAGRPGASVTETATAYGFFHLGRFAGKYRAQFGETPRETLRRGREGSER